MQILAFKRRFDKALVRRLYQKEREMRELASDSYILNIVQHARKLVMEGGKRIRPYLAYISYRAAGGRDERVIETLVGLELFHAFALVHDDIMDRGKKRHGVTTAHEKFGDAQAILLGDLLYNWAAEIIAPTKGQPIFAKMVDEVILGQMLDVDAIRRRSVSDRFIQDKMRLKTASYSFIRPMQFGVSLVVSRDMRHASRDMMNFCERFGLPLGLAFQIQDDLLDLTASSAKLGKSSMNDLREGQKTVFTQHAPALMRYKGKKLGPKEKKEIRKILEKSKAIEHGKKMMRKYFEQAERELKKLPTEKAKPFRELVGYIRARAS